MTVPAEISMPHKPDVRVLPVDGELIDACRAAMRGEPFVHPGGSR